MNVHEVSYKYLQTRFEMAKFSISAAITIGIGLLIMLGGIWLAEELYPRKKYVVHVEKVEFKFSNLLVCGGSVLAGLMVIIVPGVVHTRNIKKKFECKCPGCGRIISEIDLKHLIKTNQCRHCKHVLENVLTRCSV